MTYATAQPGTCAVAADAGLMERKPQPHLMARGRLYRAIVSLPHELCPRNEPLHERIVFFEGPFTDPAGHLETLLAHVWNIETTGWAEDGYIYNISPAFNLTEEGASEIPGARLFELSWGGPEGIGYADPARVDLFVAPMLKACLEAALKLLAKEGGAA